MGKPDFKSLMAQGGSLKGFAWPENCGDFSMRIAADGTWFYQNSPIGRKALCQLFATVLQKDEVGEYWLVTPVERGKILVEDAPFVAVEMRIEHEEKNEQEGKKKGEQTLYFRTNLDHWIRLDADHPMRLGETTPDGASIPYLLCWDGLEAKINRSVYYELVELALNQQSQEDENLNKLAIQSDGLWFSLSHQF